MTISTEDQILKLLENLTQGQERLTKDVEEIKHAQAQTNETVNHTSKDIQKLAEGQSQLRDEMELTRSEAKYNSLDTLITLNEIKKALILHKKSIEALHKGTSITDPNK